MSLSAPFKGVAEYVENAPIPRGICDGIYVLVDGVLEFTTEGGEIFGPTDVVVGQLIPFRVRQINTATTAVIAVGYH